MTESQGVGARDDWRMCSRHNGADAHQPRGYIKLLCEACAKQALQTHVWEAPGAKESDHHGSEPLSANFSKPLCELQGPAEGAPERKALESKV